MSATDNRLQRLQEAQATVNQILLGKDHQVNLAFCCLLARGHLLIEDVPGVGKTTLAHAMARVIGSDYQRIQFTSDLLPADILGVSIYKREKDVFELHPGPIFSQVILADEINRATPKTQSALLEGMAERQVTIENETYALPDPFFVMATQNPLDLVGTFPLPDSQLDRFLLSFSIGYPDPQAERALLMAEDRASLLERTRQMLTPEEIRALQEDCDAVHVSGNLLDYVQALLAETRDERWFESGLSPRAGLAALPVGLGGYRVFFFGVQQSFPPPGFVIDTGRGRDARMGRKGLLRGHCHGRYVAVGCLHADPHGPASPRRIWSRRHRR